jgi:hypothetical protein
MGTNTLPLFEYDLPLIGDGPSLGGSGGAWVAPPRPLDLIPTTVRCGASAIDGYVEELTADDVLVHLLGTLPVPGERAVVTFSPLQGQVSAQCRVTAVDREQDTCRLELSCLEENAVFLLLWQVVHADPPAGAPEGRDHRREPGLDDLR